MTSPAIDPLRLHVASFAAEGQVLEGDWAIAELPRLAESECPPDAPDGLVHEAPAAEAGAASLRALPSRASADLSRRVRWRAAGAVRTTGGQRQTWLVLMADADVVLQCQRCLQPVDWPVRVDRQFRFVDDEATAAALDDEIEEEVLVLPRSLNLRELVEDEMILGLPLVPRHEVCPEPLPRRFGETAEDDAAAHPFAGLAILRKDDAGDGGPDIG